MLEASILNARMLEARILDARMFEARIFDARMLEARIFDARTSILVTVLRIWVPRTQDSRILGWDALGGILVLALILILQVES